MKKKLQRKRFRLKDDNGKQIGNISAVSSVSKPAIERSFELFAEMPKKINFQVTNKELMVISGPAMVPGQDILRFDKEANEYYYCYFEASDVRDYSEAFLQQADIRQMNMEHADTFYNDFFVCESWIVEDPKNDKSNALGFKDIPVGTWMLSYKCTNQDMWDEFKKSGLTGFSVEISLEDYNDLPEDLEAVLSLIVDSTDLTNEEKKEAIRLVLFK